MDTRVDNVGHSVPSVALSCPVLDTFLFHFEVVNTQSGVWCLSCFGIGNKYTYYHIKKR